LLRAIEIGISHYDANISTRLDSDWICFS